MDSPTPYNAAFQILHDRVPPAAVTLGDSQADLFGQGRGFMEGFDLTMQLQVGCPGGCLFCYVRTGARLAPKDIQDRWGFEVRNKRDILGKFQRHLQAGFLADKTLYWSGVTDPYAASPAITRGIWRILGNVSPRLRPRRIAVQSRFRPDRDADVIAEYCRTSAPTDGGPAAVVSYSIGTDRDDLIRAWERATPCFASRLRTIANLRKAGLCVVATLSPFGMWNNLRSTVEQFRDWGVTYITVLFFKERTGATTTPRTFLEYLRREYSQLLDPAWQMERVHEIEDVYGRDRVLVGKPGFSSLARPHTAGK